MNSVNSWGDSKFLTPVSFNFMGLGGTFLLEFADVKVFDNLRARGQFIGPLLGDDQFDVGAERTTSL